MKHYGVKLDSTTESVVFMAYIWELFVLQIIKGNSNDVGNNLDKKLLELFLIFWICGGINGWTTDCRMANIGFITGVPIIE